MSNNKRNSTVPDNKQIIFSEAETSSFFKGARDVVEKLERHVVTMLFASIIASVAIFSFYDFCFPFEIITQKCYDYCPMLIAFAVALYAFFLSIEKKEVNQRVAETLGKGCSVASVFSATIMWFSFNALVLLVLAALCDIAQGGSTLLNILLTCYIIYIILLLIDLFEVMYGFHTFIYPEERDITDLIAKEKEATKKMLRRQNKIGLIYLLLSPFLITALLSAAVNGGFKRIVLFRDDFSYVDVLTVVVMYLLYCFVIISKTRKTKIVKTE